MARMPCASASALHSNQGWPILMPSALASLERETTQPSLLDNTTIGTRDKSGLKIRSQDT